MKLPSNLGMKLLAIYLILTGVLPLLAASAITLSSATLMALLAIVAGILLLLGR
jgi:hypothetical protein